MKPPITSPRGEDSVTQEEWLDVAQANEGIWLLSQFTYGDAFREQFKSILITPFCVVWSALVTSYVTATLFSVTPHMTYFKGISIEGTFVLCLLLLWLPVLTVVSVVTAIFFKRRVRVLLAPAGVTKLAGQREKLLHWSQVLFVVRWSGDLLFITWTEGVLVPRSTFASAQELSKVQDIARELKKSRGAAWRDEWNGKIFGQKA